MKIIAPLIEQPTPEDPVVPFDTYLLQINLKEGVQIGEFLDYFLDEVL